MLLGCGCGGVLETFMLVVAGGATLGTLWAAIRSQVGALFRRN